MGAETIGDYVGMTGTGIAEFAQWLREPIWQIAERVADQIDPALYQTVQILNAVNGVRKVSDESVENMRQLADAILTGSKEGMSAGQAASALLDSLIEDS